MCVCVCVCVCVCARMYVREGDGTARSDSLMSTVSRNERIISIRRQHLFLRMPERGNKETK